MHDRAGMQASRDVEGEDGSERDVTGRVDDGPPGGRDGAAWLRRGWVGRRAEAVAAGVRKLCSARKVLSIERLFYFPQVD